MKRFKNFIQEQHMSQGETTLSPDFLEKKQRRDERIVAKIEEPTKEIDRETKKATEEAEDVVD
jgi:hypothetical protein